MLDNIEAITDSVKEIHEAYMRGELSGSEIQEYSKLVSVAGQLVANRGIELAG